MTSSQFDPSLFLDATTTEANTRLPPLPPGDYLATVENLEPAAWASKDGTKAGMKFNVQLSVDPASGPAAQAGGFPDRLRVPDSIMLDTTPSGSLDNSQGKNGRLRVYREALGMNVPGQPFAPRMMIGRQLRVKISHREYQGEMFNQVDSVAKA